MVKREHEAAERPDDATKIKDLANTLMAQARALADESGMDLIRSLHAQFPDLPVLARSMHDETLYAERALRAGARGFIMKQEASSP